MNSTHLLRKERKQISKFRKENQAKNKSELGEKDFKVEVSRLTGEGKQKEYESRYNSILEME